jgi:hypothetical protein
MDCSWFLWAHILLGWVRCNLQCSELGHTYQLWMNSWHLEHSILNDFPLIGLMHCQKVKRSPFPNSLALHTNNSTQLKIRSWILVMMQMPSNGDAWNVVLTYRYKYICYKFKIYINIIFTCIKKKKIYIYIYIWGGISIIYRTI